MLAQILPGFRDFRTPLITGYLWLVVVWIIFGQPLPSPETRHGLVGLINAASSYLSPAAYLAVLSFVAYTVGILLAVNVTRATGLIYMFGFNSERSWDEAKGRRTLRWVWNRKNPTTARSLNWLSTRTLTKLLTEAIRRTDKRFVSPQTVWNEYGLVSPDYDEWDRTRKENDFNNAQLSDHFRDETLRTLRPILLLEMVDEIPALATKLQEKNTDLFSSYDRERSEAEFRLSVAFPIAILSIQVWALDFADDRFLSTLAAVLGVTVAIALLRKGYIKALEASSVIVTALDIGTIQSQVIQKLDDLPGPPPSDPPNI